MQKAQKKFEIWLFSLLSVMLWQNTISAGAAMKNYILHTKKGATVLETNGKRHFRQKSKRPAKEKRARLLPHPPTTQMGLGLNEFAGKNKMHVNRKH